MAIRSRDEKQRAIHALITSRSKGDSLELQLLMQGEAEAAARVRAATRRLSRKIDALIAAAMHTWRGRADALEDEMRRRNARLQARIRDIRNEIQVAENVVRATGLLDEAAWLASRLLPPS